jgi:hypothetical protein
MAHPVSPRQPRLNRLPPLDRQLVAQQQASSFDRRDRPNNRTSANRFRTARYTNDQSKRPSSTDSKIAEPSEADAPEGHGRVCEPYGPKTRYSVDVRLAFLRRVCRLWEPKREAADFRGAGQVRCVPAEGLCQAPGERLLRITLTAIAFRGI